MGDINQITWFRRFFDRLEPPFLEVGAKDYGSTQNFRAALANKGRYLGVDREPGRGVDLTLDLAQSFAAIDAALGRERFATVICLSVLEHCAQPFAMAANLSGLLRLGGHLCVSAPFAWKQHAYPADYWRFTPAGIEQLFPAITFLARTGATSRPGEFLELDEQLGKLSFSFGAHRRQGRPCRGLAAKALGLAARAGPLRWLAGHRYVLAPTNVLMLGQRRPPGDLVAGARECI